MHPFSLFATCHKSAITQNLHVVRKSRLSNIQFLKQHTAALFAMLQCQHDRKAILISQCLNSSDIFTKSHVYSLPYNDRMITYTFTVVNI